MVVDLIRSRAALEAEILTLRQQINVLRRTAPKKLSFRAIDRLVFVRLYRLFPNARDALAIVKPDHCPLAPRRIQIVLVVEVATSWRSTDGAAGNTPADPRDEHRKPTVGSAADPWRASQARYRYRSDERSQVYGQA